MTFNDELSKRTDGFMAGGINVLTPSTAEAGRSSVGPSPLPSFGLSRSSPCLRDIPAGSLARTFPPFRPGALFGPLDIQATHERPAQGGDEEI